MYADLPEIVMTTFIEQMQINDIIEKVQKHTMKFMDDFLKKMEERCKKGSWSGT